MKEFSNILAKEFADKEYAQAYMQSNCVTRIAAQIHALRKQRNLSQEELAEIAGIKQESISRIESANFDSLTMKTLFKLANAFDTNLLIKFQSFSDAIFDITNLNADALKVASREDDLSTFTTSISSVTSIVTKDSSIWFGRKTSHQAANNAVITDLVDSIDYSQQRAA